MYWLHFWFACYSDPYCQWTCLSVGLSFCLSVRIFKMLLLQQFLSELADILTQCSPMWTAWIIVTYTVWVKKIPPAVFWHFPPNGWEFLINILYIYYIFLSTQDCNFFIQLSRTLTKLCRTKRDHPSNFLHFTRTLLLSLLTEQMTSMLKPCHIQHVCWHYKNSRLPQTTINNFRKHLNACVSADVGHFEHIMWTK